MDNKNQKRNRRDTENAEKNILYAVILMSHVFYGEEESDVFCHPEACIAEGSIHKTRFFAEFILSEAEGLRMTNETIHE